MTPIAQIDSGTRELIRLLTETNIITLLAIALVFGCVAIVVLGFVFWRSQAGQTRMSASVEKMADALMKKVEEDAKRSVAIDNISQTVTRLATTDNLETLGAQVATLKQHVTETGAQNTDRIIGEFQSVIRSLEDIRRQSDERAQQSAEQHQTIVKLVERTENALLEAIRKLLPAPSVTVNPAITPAPKTVTDADENAA